MGFLKLIAGFLSLALLLLIKQSHSILPEVFEHHQGRNISCFVCFQHTNIACGGPISYDTVDPYEDIFLTDRCHICAIRNVWNGNEGTVETVERLCILSSPYHVEEGCSYHYDSPPGTREVVETCRCEDNLCNGGDITEIGGKGDINSFPKEVIYYISGSEKMSLYFYHHLVIIIILVLGRII